MTARVDVPETSHRHDVYHMSYQACPLSKCDPLAVSISDALCSRAKRLGAVSLLVLVVFGRHAADPSVDEIVATDNDALRVMCRSRVDPNDDATLLFPVSWMNRTPGWPSSLERISQTPWTSRRSEFFEEFWLQCLLVAFSRTLFAL